MKLFIAILTSFFVSKAQAEYPEIWWATRVTCNVFMGNLRVQLNEVWKDSVKYSYAGSGQDKYETLNFPTCTNDDDSMTCEGISNFKDRQIKLTITRNKDGTFKGDLNGRTLGCLLFR
jgi:hypothetical protein